MDEEEKEEQVTSADIQNMNIIDNLQQEAEFGDYDAGEEPEDEDSQNHVDEDGDFDEDDEEGEEEFDDDGSKQDKTKSVIIKQHSNVKSKNEEQDSQSKQSTACTNDEQVLLKVKKFTASSENKSSKRKISMKIKKSIKAPKLKDEHIDQATKNIIDGQLDQLIIEKPLNLQIPPGGKDRSLKEAFLRRPPNNIVTLQEGPFPNRHPSIFFQYPPFLQVKRQF